MIDAAYLNRLSVGEFEQAMLHCCASPRWVERMVAARPFQNSAFVWEVAVDAFQGLDEQDWLTAFAAHPMIGDIETLRARFDRHATWSQAEQAQVASADDAILRLLAELNRAYKEKFGFVFLICATGKSAEEMLEVLRTRIDNRRSEEVRNAANEQQKITKLRLEKLA